ncbi:MAG: BamA/TamA family outer membrane protein [Akkermansiaceae bacterium]|nr:BamA/TamA family outer membrane protein [Verrucomicrobiales bacterium]
MTLFILNAAAAEEQKSAKSRTKIERFEIIGSPGLAQETIDRVMAGATGSDVSAAQLRHSLLRLQQAYRDNGFKQVALTLPRQENTNGVVTIRVSDVSATAHQNASGQANIAEYSAPTYDFRRFEIHSDGSVDTNEAQQILASATGPAVTLLQLEKALQQLQELYRTRGVPGTEVTLPQQLLTDGTVVVRVNVGLPPEGQAGTTSTTTTSPPLAGAPAVSRSFEVRKYEVEGNTLLKPETIDQLLAPFTGTNVTIQQIQRAVGELQLAYRERGFATVGVGLPQQQLTNATVKVRVTEGRLVDVRVTGNRYFSSNNVMNTLPSVGDAMLWKDQVLNSKMFQRELDIANQNRDRQIYPTLSPGPDPGTSALELKVKDRLPLHGRLEVNNQNTPGTPEWRVNTSANYNNLWQQEHQLGLSYGFTPEEFKSEGLVPDYFFNRPLVSNFGAYYRLPYGTPDSIEERIAGSPRFGYDEATRQFRLPPAGARPDVTVYASASQSDTGIKLGELNTVADTPLLKIRSQDSGQNLSINESFGGRLNIPLVLTDTRRFNFSGGFDVKRYFLKSFNTNNFLITTTVTNAQGSQTIESSVSSPQPVRQTELVYVPLSVGIDFFDSGPRGNTAASIGFSYNLVGESADFRGASHSTNAHASFGKFTLNLSCEQKLAKGWSVLARANAQMATGALISNEQFALGGLNSVRGYYEGDDYGDAGWFGSAEIKSPFVAGRVPIWSGVVPVWLRVSAFADVGQRFLLDTTAPLDRDLILWGAGFALSANINNRLDARLAVAWPFADSANTKAFEPRAYFSLGGQF